MYIHIQFYIPSENEHVYICRCRNVSVYLCACACECMSVRVCACAHMCRYTDIDVNTWSKPHTRRRRRYLSLEIGKNYEASG